MCGRFDFHGDAIDVEAAFGVSTQGVTWPAPQYNLAPTQNALVLRPGAHAAMTLEVMRFGMDRRGGGLVLNARSETVESLATFREPYQKRRTAVLANGYFEWRLEDGKKQPYYFRRRDAGLFALAGVWQPAIDSAEPSKFVILTTAPNEVVAPYHNRMPVMLSPDEAHVWVLEPDYKAPMLRALLAPYPSAELEAFAVSRRVSSPHNNDAECIRRCEGTTF